MAIIVDPDNLDRAQIIFGTDPQLISIYDVGALITTDSSGSDGESDGSNKIFYSSGSTFLSESIAPGDVLCIFTTSSAGHYDIASVDSNQQLTINSDYSNFTRFVSATFEIREPTGGTAADGVTLQALYSFGKEEWRVDSALWGGDDLIRHEFPFEAITSEQMEVGGLAAHADWDWFGPATTNPRKDFTRKFIRTGGWQTVNTAGTNLEQWTGIITLGSLDADTQVYYQQLSASSDPVDFKFLGAVNEPIFVSSSTDPRVSYLKLFARKKARTYAQSEIADIGVSTIRTIVNRFPLAHTTDPAIVATDAQILGTAPFRNQNVVTGALDGVTADVSTALGAFTSSDGTFVTQGVIAGDTLHIGTGSNDTGYWTISSVDTETTLTIDTDESGPFVGASSLDFEITTTEIIRSRGDGEIHDFSTALGNLTSSTGGFSGAVAAGDFVILNVGTDPDSGVYEVDNVVSDTILQVDTTDHTFPSSPSSSITFTVVEPGMYLQYKQEDITLGTTDELTFVNANPDEIYRETGSWVTDGVSSGSIIEVAGGLNDAACFTVASITTTSASNDTVVLVATDAVTAQSGTSASTLTVYDPFKRTINNVVYGFHWRILGNSAGLSDIYQFVQHQLRQTTDIDYGPAVFRGDVTDLLMAFSTPTATTTDAFIDKLDATDTNNVTYTDACGVSRTFPFQSVGSLSFNSNLQNDASAEYWMFFTNDDAGDNLGRDFSTPSAIIVQDNDGNDISGSVGGAGSVQFTYDYDGNVQRGAASAGVDAPVTVVAIGLATAQYVITTDTIARTKTNNISLVAALERNYSNP